MADETEIGRFWNDSLASHYRVYRDYAQHEDDLINHRSTWNHTIQGLLFAAFGLSLQGHADSAGSLHLAPIQWALLFVLPILGFVLSIAAWASIWAATIALDELGRQWKQILAEHPISAKIYLPDLAGAGKDHAKRWGKTPAYAIPICIGVAWCVIFVAAVYTALT